MEDKIHAVITGTGSYIPRRKVSNSDFLKNTFLNNDGIPLGKDNEETIQKFAEITGIQARRYAADDVLASDMGAEAGEQALASAELDPEKLDYIIVAHNFGDVRADNPRVDMVPTLASRVKHKLGIKNPHCIAYDLPFGCPGWIQGLIQCNYYLRSGDALAGLVIGTETLSRICDPHDRDSMIYSDGAGAAVLEGRQSSTPVGILSHSARTDTEEQAYYLKMDSSYHPDHNDALFMKMKGRKLYQYALTHVPNLVKTSLEKANIGFDEVAKVLIHQANAKMDAAILQRLAKLYGYDEISEDIMPMTISQLGNSSVATVPTLLDLVLRGKMENQHIDTGDVIVLASVGAGMNINSIVYQMD
ncbi:3-oxoacyl-ACP synthase III family protein [Fodinibius sediminis]|uniref:3-oxoacyl-[acyl-carrier-protein] synthase-3 n=1 Tax=Fodinibius sediminis TaxID=1214077 RepID=A0A521EDT2_9BACT|nr:ketoacyl-ACP synthase III [Fodinibius sediminis]SMO82068.1 3-oxoacyl-[acyl-carrier-protein] synthase-3 [Fodinibius sediminis]